MTPDRSTDTARFGPLPGGGRGGPIESAAPPRGAAAPPRGVADGAALPWWRRYEAPTWAVAIGVYAGFGLTTWTYHALPWWLVLPLGAWFVCWQGSLQHEAMHGHPTRSATINALVALPSLWLWLPYPLYREFHLTHHGDVGLTDPIDDPESYYVTPEAWARMAAWRRALLTFRNTLAGRLLIGPAMAYAELARGELRRLHSGDASHVVDWLVHALVVAAILYWVIGVCGIPLWAYVLFFAYPGLSLTMLRSFAEHRPAHADDERTVVVEASPPMRLLFLNNNYHAPHHAEAGLPWYELHGRYRAHREAFLARNGGYRFSGYAEQFRRFLFTPKDSPVHPLAEV